MDKKRVLYLDVCRIVATFFMVMIHVVAPLWGGTSASSDEWGIMNIYDSIARFCVPLFLMISGALMLDKNKEKSTTDLFKKNILRIIIAFVFWSAIYLIPYYFYDGVRVKTQFMLKFQGGHYHMWFLFTILGIYLMIPLIKSFIYDDKKCKYFLILWLVFSIIIPNIYLISELFPNLPHFLQDEFRFLSTLSEKIQPSLVLGYVGYFVLGYYLHNKEISSKLTTIINISAIIGIVATIIMTKRVSILRGENVMYFYEFLTPNVLLPSIAVMISAKKLVPNEMNLTMTKVLTSLSKLSLGIYLSHALFEIILRRNGINVNSLNYMYMVPILTLLIYLLSAFTTYIISKIPVLRKYIV
ncbi:surface polysaccharide O-acyltransferase-like enzyme [Breznakia sp. PF5-3]|uniref:acyltransferase n=1 Tax=unclassified Breznakia TaxID=2623764 RepID=UPI00240554A1|nr:MULTISPECIES: acyltransferase family protein [unclassified Breznakia]MDF9824772.1 surface polysaccharide O-acyltransferase-like enzyme [Breznakia sp. PM6-1]MDF9835772.1 surface polysaccharide O-acyltransferase-like enzyme [Breznakia sp. PF5-3]MDF9837859.1 surface polysaccharide O-acyltransferase-like enzyme [Breznakia sp. PFB2-8]MDF9859771.1 surface polysaccharide O-acyltransferase-like enzyme [Breznakia sp. PH5-24]